jgi:hypothetical protein
MQVRISKEAYMTEFASSEWGERGHTVSKSTEPSPRAVAVTQEDRKSLLLVEPEDLCRARKSPPLGRILRQTNGVDTLTHYFFKIHLSYHPLIYA